MEAVRNAIFHRLSLTPEVFTLYGDEAVWYAVCDVADFVGDVEEIGTSDVSCWVNSVLKQLVKKC